MVLSVAIILCVGLVAQYIFTKLRLPGFIGVLIAGSILGPFVLDAIDSSILDNSEDIRKIALVIILLRAGLGIQKQTLAKVGMPALRLGFIPVLFEGTVILLVAYYVLGMSIVEAGMLGFIIAAVSPAVIVPQMLKFIERKKGEKSGIPTMILTGASFDDVVAITVFSCFVGFYLGQDVSITMQVFMVPLSIIIGIVCGVVLAIALLFVFSKTGLRYTHKTVLLLAVALFLTSLESMQTLIPVASLLGVMVIGYVLLERSQTTAHHLSSKLQKTWLVAEIFLFFLVGAALPVTVILEAGMVGLLIIVLGLLARAAGVYVSLFGTSFSLAEKFFCMCANIPKATVQAAIGSIPLTLGLPYGEIILTIAVLSIVITAPIGAFITDKMGEKIL